LRIRNRKWYHMHIIHYLRMTSCNIRCTCPQVLRFPEDVIDFWSKPVEASKISNMHFFQIHLCVPPYYFTLWMEKGDPYIHGVTSQTTECLSVIFILGRNMMCLRTERVSSTQSVLPQLDRIS
jgi:hypothetical protein